MILGIDFGDSRTGFAASDALGLTASTVETFKEKNMKIRELATYCKSIDIDCDRCEHKDACKQMQSFLEDQSPYGLVKFVDENKDTEKWW